MTLIKVYLFFVCLKQELICWRRMLSHLAWITYWLGPFLSSLLAHRISYQCIKRVLPFPSSPTVSHFSLSILPEAHPSINRFQALD
jgi:hypothetical protein